MKPLLKIFRITSGILFLILGFLGLFLPVLQGILFLGTGLLLLSVDIPFFHRFVVRLENRFPVLREKLGAWRRRLGHGGEDGPDENPQKTGR
ncbi:MAG TPA: hypothetical protein VL688_09155 [Verrucomicrobiae bacterium]|jgi:uncharacterized membrane protein YbaN (DUF454 family)|nr:hypothetical protein [Verrucomicrobiae bacterium]